MRTAILKRHCAQRRKSNTGTGLPLGTHLPAEKDFETIPGIQPSRKQKQAAVGLCSSVFCREDYDFSQTTE